MEAAPQTANGTQKKARNSNMEILRIICMILIVAYHFVGNTQGFIEYPQYSTFNLVAYHTIGLWGQAAVLCFVMITGYYTVTGAVRVSKILRLAIETWFYSILITALMVYTGILEYDFEVGLRTFFPLLMRDYWFITDYIILLLLAPLLNRLVRSTTKKELGYLMGVLLVAAYFLSGMREFDYVSTPAVLVVFYLLAAYIRLYPNRLTESRRIAPVVLLACVVFGYLLMDLMNGIYQGTAKPLKTLEEDPELLKFFAASVIILAVLALAPIRRKKETLALALVVLIFASILVYMPYRGLDIRGFVEERYSILMGLAAVSLFLTFKNMKPRSSRAVNWLAGGTLGVYLIHNHWYLQLHYWKELFPVDMLMQDWFPVRALAVIVGLVLLFLVVDRVRELIFLPFARLRPVRAICGKMDSEFSELFAGPEERRDP